MVQLHKFACPCGYVISAAMALLGKDINCPKCNLLLKLPASLDEPSPKTSQQQQVCGHCGHINIDPEGICQYCGEILLPASDLEMQKNIEQPSSPQLGEKIREEKRYIELFITAVIFIIGFIIGVMLCPGHWGILPPGYKILPFIFSN